MNESTLCEVFRMRLGELFTCTEQGPYQRVRTPYLYPDGDNIDLFCKSEGDVITVTDLAETTRWLRMQSVAVRRSPKQRQLIEDACLTHGVEFYRGMLQARCRQDESLAAVVTRGHGHRFVTVALEHTVGPQPSAADPLTQGCVRQGCRTQADRDVFTASLASRGRLPPGQRS